MSNSFELKNKPDEWMDITSKEEILQSELNQLKNDLETRSIELLESNVTIDLLKGHKTLLENERQSLRSTVDDSNQTIELLQKQVEELKKVNGTMSTDLSELKNKYETETSALRDDVGHLKGDLESANNKVTSLNKQVKTLEQQNQLESKKRADTIRSLSDSLQKFKLATEQKDQKTSQQAQSLARLQKELEQTQDILKSRTGVLGLRNIQCDKLKAELKEKSDNLLKVSTLSEGLKNKNMVLLRTLNNVKEELAFKQKELAQSRARVQALERQAEFQSIANGERLHKLHETVQSKTSLLEEAKTELEQLRGQNTASTEEMAQKDTKLSQARAQLEAKELAYQQVVEKLEALQKKTADEEAKRMEVQETEEGKNSEKALREELARQKQSFEKRMRELHEILGVTAMTEIKSEFGAASQEISELKQASVRSFRVPLFFGLK